MPTKTITLTPTSAKLVTAFDEAAKDWGWQIDQGSGAAHNRSEFAYINADAALRKHISALERKVRRLKDELRGVSPEVTGDRRDWTKAKAAISTSHIKIERPDGRVETVKNPFYSEPISDKERRKLIDSVIVPKVQP